MRYVEPVFRPPSEAHSFILQATIGCSWNHCTYCDMYRSKQFSVRPLDAILADVHETAAGWGEHIRKVFVADGDPLVMELDHWLPILEACREGFPHLRRVSTYATARNILDKTVTELRRLREEGLSLLYIGPESGDDITSKRIAKGADFADHVEAARRCHAAGITLSAIFLTGAGGIERSREHAAGSARLATAMNPRYLSLLTLTVLPDTPMGKLLERGQFRLPDVAGLLEEIRIFVDKARPEAAIFRTNHASNYLPLEGRLPRDRERIVATIDAALSGRIPLKPEHHRGL